MELAGARADWSQEALELAQEYHAGRRGSRHFYRKGCRCPECVEANRQASSKGSGGEERERRPSSSSGSRQGGDKRHQRRAAAAASTIRDFTRLRRPDLDTEAMGLLEVIDRDAEAWGDALAWLAELLLPLGLVLDAIAGAPPVAVIVRLVPSFRAARRARIERRARAEAEAAEAELAGEQPAGEEGLRVMPGLEHHQPAPVEPEHQLTREEWLAGGGGGQ